jgi:hypothetical protein
VTQPTGEKYMHHKYRYTLSSLLLMLLACGQSVPLDSVEIKKEIFKVLDSQVEGWNTCDLEKYMQGYWNSDSLRFASGGEVRFGWQETLKGYMERYPDKKAIGYLTFHEINIDVLSNNAALVFGRWTLKRDMDNPTGLFTLLFKRIDNSWRIVCDHTSSSNISSVTKKNK